MTYSPLILAHLIGDYILQNDWMAQRKTSRTLPCLVHCVLYTCSVWMITAVEAAPWPLWALAICFVAHFVVDRWRLAAVAMKYVGQSDFRDNLGPWSVFIVDNTWHLITLYVLHRAVQ